MVSNNKLFTRVTLLIIAFVLISSITMVLSQENVYAASAKPAKVVISSIKSVDHDSIKITWKAAKNANSYQVYRSTAKNGTYKLIKTTSARNFTNKKLITGKKYYYKVRAINGKKKGAFSEKKYAIPSLKQGNISAITSTDHSITITAKKVNGASGYQIFKSSTKNGTYKKIGSTVKRTFTDNKLSENKKYFYKVRPYKKVNGKIKTGKFSPVKSIKTKYSYTLYFLNNYNYPLYTNSSEVAIFIKTKDTNTEYWDFVTDTGHYANMGYPEESADLAKALINEDNFYEYFEAVPGGYVCKISISTSGTHLFKFVIHKDDYSKYYGASYANYNTIKSFKLTFNDYTTAYKKWICDTVEYCTNETMSPIEKMRAIESYLTSDEAGYTYNTNISSPNSYSGFEYAYLAIGDLNFDRPFWQKKMWDSYVTPAVLTDIANYIGGFDSVKNMYPVYSYGTLEWTQYHYICRITYKGETYDFQICPYSDTASLDYIKTPDFTDTSWMYKIN